MYGFEWYLKYRSNELNMVYMVLKYGLGLFQIGSFNRLELFFGIFYKHPSQGVHNGGSANHRGRGRNILQRRERGNGAERGREKPEGRGMGEEQKKHVEAPLSI